MLPDGFVQVDAGPRLSRGFAEMSGPQKDDAASQFRFASFHDVSDLYGRHVSNRSEAAASCVGWGGSNGRGGVGRSVVGRAAAPPGAADVLLLAAAAIATFEIWRPS